MSKATILQGDVRDVLATLPERHFHCAVTSPPYWGLRSYLPANSPDKAREIGSEKTPQEFVATMVDVFQGVWRVLRDDGVLWLNIGDSYAGGGRGGDTGRSTLQGSTIGQDNSKLARKIIAGGLKPKDLCGVPWRVALALQADGWTLRDAVIWWKPSPMPSSQRDRCTSAYEFLFQLTKRATYYFDIDAIRTEPTAAGLTRIACPSGRGRADEGSFHNHEADEFRGQRNEIGPSIHPNGCAPRNVWRISSDGYKGEHYATFPVELPARCIKASTSAKGCCPDCGAPWRRIVDRTPVTRERPNELTKRTGVNGTGNHCANTVAGVEARTLGWEPACGCQRDDVERCRVLDPFNGAGTTAIACRRLGVDYTGIELDARAIEQTHARLRKEANRGAKVERIESAAGQQELFR